MVRSTLGRRWVKASSSAASRAVSVIFDDADVRIDRSQGRPQIMRYRIRKTLELTVGFGQDRFLLMEFVVSGGQRTIPVVEDLLRTLLLRDVAEDHHQAGHFIAGPY